MLRNTCRLDVGRVNEMQLQLQCTWCCLQSISREHMTRLRVSAVFHRSVEDYCQQLLQLRLDLRLLYTKQQQQQQYKQQPHNYCGKNGAEKAAATLTAESVDTLELERDHLRQHLLKREQLLLEVGRMVRLGRLLKTRLKEPFILDASSGKR